MPRTKKGGAAKGNGVEIIGEAYRELKIILAKYAKAGLPVMLIGESGTGKELLARHYAMNTGRYSDDKYIPVNCAGRYGDVLASELFGHEKGAFTGATQKRMGIFHAHNRGVVFLDEIGDADDNLQASLLRIIEYKTLRPVGSDIPKEVDVLIVAATNRPENIRDDLKSRFHTIHVPPLQKFDIPVLVDYFMGGLPPKDIMDDLLGREYQCNIRELEKVCNAIKAERSDLEIKKQDHKNNVVFNYTRYSHEIGTWCKFIAPVFAQEKIPPAAYQYTSRIKTTPSELRSRGSFSHRCADMYARHYLFGEIKVQGTVSGENKAAIKSNLTSIIDQGYLPNFLDLIVKRCIHYRDEGKRSNQNGDKPLNNTPPRIYIDGNFYELSTEEDCKDAIYNIRHACYAYQYNCCNGVIQKAATKLGVSENTLRKYL